MLGDMIQPKTLHGVPKLMGEYKAYKSNYMRNMVFDPWTPGLSM